MTKSNLTGRNLSVKPVYYILYVYYTIYYMYTACSILNIYFILHIVKISGKNRFRVYILVALILFDTKLWIRFKKT